MQRRLVPDDAQIQIILGSLLGDARIEGRAGARRMRVAQPMPRERYVRWKYERLVPLSDREPCREDDAIAFVTIAHPLFDDLHRLLAAPRGRRVVMHELLGPLGLAVWMSDVGRLELRPDLFVPRQRTLALTA